MGLGGGEEKKLNLMEYIRTLKNVVKICYLHVASLFATMRR